MFACFVVFAIHTTRGVNAIKGSYYPAADGNSVGGCLSVYFSRRPDVRCIVSTTRLYMNYCNSMDRIKNSDSAEYRSNAFCDIIYTFFCVRMYNK